MLDTYAVIAEPSRRRILDRLLQSDSSVSELARDLGLSQPLISNPHFAPLMGALIIFWEGFRPWMWNALSRQSVGRRTSNCSRIFVRSPWDQAP
ncbi:ArsR family transcriptional regulator [Alicyclobacillus macrosporangiidus]|uniref:Regulatory protein, arsR family n=1 Tax=Alicyclobacillus macrosporangiidus TaxID=392015 RepID=A0A1I7KHU2_9BACL|nr:regulatory protein, arsR family [Alicyclobacillus macrosporangiidus]